MADYYTSNIDYPARYYRAYMTPSITSANKTDTKYTYTVRYGIALYDGYSSSTTDSYIDRYVAVSSKLNGSSGYHSDTGWVQDKTALSGTGSNWWHETGSTSIVVNRTESDQTLVITVWGYTDYSGTRYTKSSPTYTIPALESYTITFKPNGGTSGKTTTGKKYYGKTYTIPSSATPTRTGYTFVGWNTSSTATTYQYKANSSYTTNAAVTLYAIWKKDITITYDSNGGTAGSKTSETATIYNATTSHTFSLPSTSAQKPSKTGWELLGWNKSKTATSASYTSSITLSDSDTLYAIWRKQLQIIYDSNGGSSINSTSTYIYNSATSANLTVTTSQPTLSGYNFDGWYTSKTGGTKKEANSTLTISSNTTLYAHWSLQHTQPKIITPWKCKRSNGTTESDTGNFGYIYVKWDLGKDDSNDDITTTLIKARYREKDTSTWAYITGSDSTWTPLDNSTTTFEAHFGAGNITSEKQYEVEVLLSNEDYTDSPTTKTDFISNETFVIDINANGSAIGLLQPVEDNVTGVFYKGKELLDLFYPVGSYYETSDANFNPNTAWGGTWYKEIQGQVHISAGSNYTVSGTDTTSTDSGETRVGTNRGGATSVSYTPSGTNADKTVSVSGTVGSHKLTVDEMPSHGHKTLYENSGGGYAGGFKYVSGTNTGGISGSTSLTSSYVNPTGGGDGHSHTFSGSSTAHTHTFTGTAKNINVMQPYIAVYRWHRTA